MVDIQTKTGITDPGWWPLDVRRQQSWLQPSLSMAGSAAGGLVLHRRLSHNDIGIENPAASFNAMHDTTNQFHGLAYASDIIDPNTRISLILGARGQFQIPNNPGQSHLRPCTLTV